MLIPPRIDGYTVTKISERAFRYHGASKIVIPDTVIEIERKAFFACLGLASVTLGSGVEKISDNAFDSCNSF